MKAVVIGVIILVIALLVAGVVIWFRKQRSKEKALEHGWAVSGDLNGAEEHRLLEHLTVAELLFKNLTNVDVLTQSWQNPYDVTILSEKHKREVGLWLQEHDKLTKQIIRRK